MGQQTKPAGVTFVGGQLTVTAENSDLAQILERISNLSGMQVSGLASRAHVFGVYGPGTPQSVLTKLLTGSGYNFMMVGRTAMGAPRRLLLMTRSDAPESAAPAMLATPAQQPDGSTTTAAASNVQQDTESNSSPASQYQEPLGPGAIAHVPPSEQPGNQEDPQTRLQQHLQQLEQQHQTQSQQQEQPQP
jgi:hypothetical protein